MNSACNKSKQNFKIKKILNILLLGIICSFLTASGSLLWKLGSKQISTITSIIFNIPVIIGFSIQILAFILYYEILKKGEINFIASILALNFIWVIILSKLVLKETINVSKIIGSLIIVFGIIRLSISTIKEHHLKNKNVMQK